MASGRGASKTPPVITHRPSMSLTLKGRGACWAVACRRRELCPDLTPCSPRSTVQVGRIRCTQSSLSSRVLERAHNFALCSWIEICLRAHAALGLVLPFKDRHDAAIAAFEKAMTLNSNYGSFVRGDSKRAIEVVHAHMRLDPLHEPYASVVLAFANDMLEQYS